MSDMPFFARHLVQRVFLAISGILVSSFGPEQVPETYRPLLFWAGIAMAVFAVFVWPIIGAAWRNLRQSNHSQRHSELLKDIADKLGRLRDLAYSPGSWERVNPQGWQVDHNQKYEAVKRDARALVNQISYDEATYRTCDDYMHLCSMIVHDQLHKDTESARRNLADLDRVGRGLFRYLHAGKSVNRHKIELPQWVLVNDALAAKRAKESA